MSLTSDELDLIDHLIRKLRHHDTKNAMLEQYYEGKNRLKDLNISIPPSLKLVDSVIGWSGTAVDVLEERLDLEGYIGGDAYGLNDIFRANDLDLEASLGHKDAFVFGTSFVFVGKGMEGEADPLITIESPKKATAIFDMRSRRITAAILVNRDEWGEPRSGSLYLPDQTIYFEKANAGRWIDVARDFHGMGRVSVAPLINNPRAGDPDGRSEITKSIRSLQDSAMRTMLGAEVAREFYSAPQRYVLGAKEDTFTDSDGNPLDRWKIIQGRMLGLPYNDEDGVMPQVGQFSANSPSPFFEQVRQLAQLFAAESAIPTSYLGFQTDNPASADAIRQMESRLVKKAERRQRQFGRTWTEVARLALMVRDGEAPIDIMNVRPIWRDASTPTRAAAADEAVKLISAGVFTADSDVVYNRLGLSDSDKQVIKAEKAAQSSNTLIENILKTQTPNTGQ